MSTPVYYTLEITGLAVGAGNAQTQTLVFNDPGSIVGVTFCSIDAAGAAQERAAFTLNIQRQNQFGLTTRDTSAAAFTGTGERPFSLPAIMGDYRVARNDQLQITVTNFAAAASSRLWVTFLLRADRDGLA
jgi:hypothetical protein